MIEDLDSTNFKILDEWQRDLPLTSNPFSQIGKSLGCQENEIIERIRNLTSIGHIARVGATCAPNTISASTLAAMAVPAKKIESVAKIVGDKPAINHSYLRENKWNLWFVATGPDRKFVNSVLEEIEKETGFQVLDLRLIRPFNVDLGFNLDGSFTKKTPKKSSVINTDCFEENDREILNQLSKGMEICQRPYKQIAENLNRTESQIIERIDKLQSAGIISRLGVIVRHRSLGWKSNAMVVWDIDSDRIDSAGPALAVQPGITLCYERRPVSGIWPFRLYNMIHAKSRDLAMKLLAEAEKIPELSGVSKQILFSTRCFKQSGAMISKKRVQ